MKKAFLALVAIGILVGAVLVVWELVANPGPLRLVYWRLRDGNQQAYEARLQMTLREAISDEQLAEENRLLDNGDVLLPVVRSVGLVEKWQLEGEWAAVERLASNSILRRGDTDLSLVLAVRDPDQETAGKLIQPLGKSFLDKKQQGGGLPVGPGSVPAGQ